MTTTTTAAKSIAGRFARLATVQGANERFAHEWRAGRWPVALPVPHVGAVRSLRLHPSSRHTFLYSIEGWPETECIAKIYAHHLPTTSSHVLAPLLAAGFAAPGRYRAAEVIAELPALRLVLSRVAPGMPASARLREGDLEAAARAGEWLGAFHAAPLPLPAAYALHDPLARAARWAARLACHSPELADRASALYAQLLRTRRPWPGDVRLIHGDFVAEHVFVATQTTTAIDWDSCRVGDPAEDAGRLIASLWHLAARGRISQVNAAAAERRFRTAYAAAQPAIAAQLPFYAALACLHKASRSARHGARRYPQVSALLAAGLAELTG